MDLGYLCTVTLTLEVWPWVEVMTHPWVMDNNCVKYYPDPTWQWGVMARTRILGMCAVWPWPWRYDIGSRSWHTFGSWTTIVWNIIQIKLGSGELWLWILGMCALWPWPLRYDLGSRSWHTLWSRSWHTLKYYLDPTWQWGVIARTRIFGMCVLWLWPWRYDLGSISWHTLWSWTTIVWNIIQIVKSGQEVMARTRCEQTDGQTDRQTCHEQWGVLNIQTFYNLPANQEIHLHKLNIPQDPNHLSSDRISSMTINISAMMGLIYGF